MKNPPDSAIPFVPLSDREKEVLLMICRGMSTQKIAASLGLSKRTGDSHRANIRAKTGCRNAASLVAYAIRAKLVEF